MEVQHYGISTISSDLPTKYVEFLKQFIEITRPISKPCLNSKTRPFAHKITTHGPPVTTRANKLAAKTQIRESLDFGINRPSSSMYGSPIHMTRKKTTAGECAVTTVNSMIPLIQTCTALRSPKISFHVYTTKNVTAKTHSQQSHCSLFRLLIN